MTNCCRPDSNPAHSRYRQHLSAGEVHRLTIPLEETVLLVEAWLFEHGILNLTYSPAKDWISTLVPIRTIEALLNTTYRVFQDLEEHDYIVRTTEWSLPIHLHEHIELIQPTNSFFRPRASLRNTSNSLQIRDKIPTYEELAGTDVVELGHIDIPDAKDLPPNPTVSQACKSIAISPLCLRALYGTLHYGPQVSGKNRMALVNFRGRSSHRSDIRMFMERYRPDYEPAKSDFDTELVAGGKDDQSPEGNIVIEGDLDAEAALGIAYPTPLTTYNVGGTAPFEASVMTPDNNNEPYLEWLQYVLAKEELPQVITLSYADEEQTVPYSYAKRVCEGFAQLGARGVTVLIGSGDDGVGRDGTCYSNDGNRKPQFLPTFPASCPFVTTVGATRELGPERVAFDGRTKFVSGSGFSNYFERPWYQRRHVDGYLNKHLGGLHRGLYNEAGRAYPDISAQGYHYSIVWNGTAHLIDGTSASSPTVAGIVALVNDALIADGKPPLGFLNPWIYSKASEAFTDVTIGSATGCNTSGFPAAPGWDAGSGLGTPVSIFATLPVYAC